MSEKEFEELISGNFKYIEKQCWFIIKKTLNLLFKLMNQLRNIEVLLNDNKIPPRKYEW